MRQMQIFDHEAPMIEPAADIDKPPEPDTTEAVDDDSEPCRSCFQIRLLGLQWETAGESHQAEAGQVKPAEYTLTRRPQRRLGGVGNTTLGHDTVTVFS